MIQRLIVGNVAALSIYTLIFCIWIIVLRKKFHPYIFLISLSLLPILSILRHGTYESGDLTFQAYRTLEFFRNLQAGHVIPQWASEMNATYGYPSFIFTYQLPYYISSFFHLIGFDLIQSVKATLILVYILSGVFFYAWIRKHCNTFGATFGSILYLFAPYRFVNMHFRATLGETTAMMIVPLCLYGAYMFSKNKSFRYELLYAAAIGLLILSHQAIALICLPFIFVYSFYLDYSKLASSVRPYIMGELLTAYFWIPLIYDSQFTLQFFQNSHIVFNKTWEYLVSPWRYGLLFQGHYGELSPAIGYIHIVGICVGIWLTIKMRASKFLIFLLLSFFFFFFLAQSFSPFWYIFPFFQKIQFSYRLVSILVLVSSSIGACIVSELKPYRRKITAILAFIAIFSTILNWGNRRVIQYPTSPHFEAFLPYISEKGEGFDPAIPKWVNPSSPWQKVIPQSHLSGAHIINEHRKETVHEYTVLSQKISTIIEYTYYFPGWKVFIDGIEKEIQPTQNGLISFQIEPGRHFIQVKYSDTKIHTFAKYISLATIFFIILGLLTYRRN